MCNNAVKKICQKMSFTHVVENFMHNFLKTLNIVFIKRIIKK